MMKNDSRLRLNLAKSLWKGKNRKCENDLYAKTEYLLSKCLFTTFSQSSAPYPYKLPFYSSGAPHLPFTTHYYPLSRRGCHFFAGGVSGAELRFHAVYEAIAVKRFLNGKGHRNGREWQRKGCA
ncbi:hypothetical protein JTE90_021583 [Oedothorax gibbosus]|uniref:Uncharacterized protein n=1 Tax=Oedothorax gibbosus TaxID=931172 RepID=A0AAV6VP56_9ARAC|nr:hypothetical protein JTE90_021583 [Oedothorax gibbosus]